MDSDLRVLDFTFVLVVISALLFLVARKRKESTKLSSYPLPPGPKGLPIIANLFNMPTEKEWLTFTEWGKTYGNPYFS